MRKSALLAAAWTVLVLTGCDNLAKVPENPYIQPRQAVAVPENPTARAVNRSSLEETFRFAANIHDTMRRYRDVLLATPADSEKYATGKSVLVSENAQWRHLLYIREEWMGQGEFGPEHPSRKIRLAIYYLVEESKALDNHFLHNDPLDPHYAADTDKAFEEAITALRNYKDPSLKKK